MWQDINYSFICKLRYAWKSKCTNVLVVMISDKISQRHDIHFDSVWSVRWNPRKRHTHEVEVDDVVNERRVVTSWVTLARMCIRVTTGRPNSSDVIHARIQATATVVNMAANKQMISSYCYWMAHYHYVVEQLPTGQLDEAVSITDYATHQVTATVVRCMSIMHWRHPHN